jgi:hypothetical protein
MSVERAIGGDARLAPTKATGVLWKSSPDNRSIDDFN